MDEEDKQRERRTRRDLRWALVPAGIFLLLYLVIPTPWNDYSLVLGIAFAIMSLGVIATR